MSIQTLFAHFSTTTVTTFSLRQAQTVGVLLVLTSGLPPSGVLAEIEVECFDCSWQSSSAPQNSEQGQEFCLPEHFQRDKVKTISCSQGCMITSMYENDPDGPVTTLQLRDDDSKTSTTAITTKQTSRPPMSFFTRGCGDSTRKDSGCEEKSYQHVVREECFCTTELCNGNGTPISKGPHQQIMLFLSFLAMIIKAMM